TRHLHEQLCKYSLGCYWKVLGSSVQQPRNMRMDRIGMASASHAQHLEAAEISHFYGGVQALDNVGFGVTQGEVHALIGENGAGKSTLIKVLTGSVRPTRGELRTDGRALEINSPADAHREGIGVVHQDYNLFPQLSVAANIVGVSPGFAPTRALLSDVGRAREKARELMGRLGLELDP